MRGITALNLSQTIDQIIGFLCHLIKNIVINYLLSCSHIQFINAMEKISKILEASGSSLDKVLKVSVFLSKPEFFQEMNDLFGKHFGKEPPVRTTIVTNFTSPEVLVELDVTATQ